MKNLQPVRGTRDILFNELKRHMTIVNYAQKAAEYAGFHGIETPMFEDSNVFYRLGESSDVVSKETYTFHDRGGDSITLRPEGTAPVVRALISNGLTQSMPLKLFYTGPMFRYDRPQKGRYRQFAQIGIESFGVETYHADVECLQIAEKILLDLKIRDKVVLKINTLGDAESRAAYRAKLIAYFSQFRHDLSDDSKIRLEKNPLRILDSKDPKDQDLIQEAPLYRDFLTPAAKIFFDHILNALERLAIPYVQDDRLVRGLDYYCHTAFEYVTQDLGTQGTVLAGGRYDGLVAAMGGPDIPGVGWAGGIDRLALLSQLSLPMPRPVILLPLGESAEQASFILAEQLRKQGLIAQTFYTGNLGKRLKKTTKFEAQFALIFGEDELQKGHVRLKDLDQTQEEIVTLEELPSVLKGKIK